MVDGVQEGVDGYMKTWTKEGGSSDRHFRVVDNGKKSKQLEMRRWSTTSLNFSEDPVCRSSTKQRKSGCSERNGYKEYRGYQCQFSRMIPKVPNLQKRNPVDKVHDDINGKKG